MKSSEVMTIGEVASRSGMPPKTIRFYEEIGLIAPADRLGTVPKPALNQAARGSAMQRTARS